MTPRSDARVEALFARYWDDALTPAEFDELAALLRADPDARERLRFGCLLATVSTERPAVAPPPLAEPVGRWSRRRVLTYLGGGLALGLAAPVIGRRFFTEPPPARSIEARLTAVTGLVRIVPAVGRQAAVGTLVAAGSVLTSHGHGSAATLTFSDGTVVTLAGETSVVFTGDGRGLFLQGGAATATLPPAPDDPPLTLSTAEASLTPAGAAVLSLDRVARATEVGVRHGQVLVAAPGGQSPTPVHGGERLTVRSDGNRRKERLAAAPERYAWDLAGPAAGSWQVGHREWTADGPVVRPDLWYDPYHGTEMWQVRLPAAWSCGYVTVRPDSVLSVRYRVARPGMSQVGIVVRSEDPAAPSTGVLEVNGAFDRADPGRWHRLEVRAADMLGNRHAPGFGPPWVGFMLFVNTFEADLGLAVADFRVTRPGPRPA